MTNTPTPRASAQGERDGGCLLPSSVAPRIPQPGNNAHSSFIISRMVGGAGGTCNPPATNSARMGMDARCGGRVPPAASRASHGAVGATFDRTQDPAGVA